MRKFSGEINNDQGRGHRGERLHGRRAAAPALRAPEGAHHRGHLGASGRRAPRQELSAPARAERSGLPGHPARAARRGGRRGLPGPAAHGVAAADAGAASPGAEGGRPLGGLPLEECRPLHHLVQGSARGRGGAGRGGLRPAGAAPEGHRGRLAGRLAGLLSDGGAAGHRAAAQERTWRDRGHRDRRQVGVTGAGAQGRKADPMYLFTEANENVQAYGMASHRHTPEIEQELSALAGQPVVVSFTPHLVPLNRGLFTTASVPLTKPATTAELVALYREFYAGEPFVRVLDEGQRPTTRSVVGSNYCDVTVVADPRTKRAVCVSALDNLGKGGSANGIQNLNIMMGWDERTGLDAPPVYP